jgi:hypothetical protein
VYRTADIIEWMIGGREQVAQITSASEPRSSRAITEDALHRLRAIKTGAK